MKLTGNLKKTVEKAQTKEEAKDAIKKAGMLLTDDELDQVSGGGFFIKRWVIECKGSKSSGPCGYSEIVNHKPNQVYLQRGCLHCGGELTVYWT